MATRFHEKYLREILSEVPPDTYRAIRDSYLDASSSLRDLVRVLEKLKKEYPRGPFVRELKIAQTAQFELDESSLGDVV